jgi:hypothetical protein
MFQELLHGVVTTAKLRLRCTTPVRCGSGVHWQCYGDELIPRECEVFGCERIFSDRPRAYWGVKKKKHTLKEPAELRYD